MKKRNKQYKSKYCQIKIDCILFRKPCRNNKQINKKLKIRKTELTLIPTDAGGEVRCYEFLCETEDGQEILIYINAVTGEEERILILLKSDGGTLAK